MRDQPHALEPTVSKAKRPQTSDTARSRHPSVVPRVRRRRALGLVEILGSALGGLAQDLQDLLNVQLTSALPESPAEAEAELWEVESLLEKIENLGGLDTKRDRVINWVKRLTADGRSVLVFTSYADTMEYLRDAVLSAGVPFASYSGEGGAIRADGECVTVAKEQLTGAL